MGVVDSHLHFWDPRIHDYSWLESEPQLLRSFLPEDLDTGDSNVSGLVFVQAEARAEQGIAEVEWVNELAADGAPVLGIVAFAPVENTKNLPIVLGQLRSMPHVVGVRRLLQSEDNFFLFSPELAAGLRRLGKSGLTFDACVRFHQLLALDALLRTAPDVTVVIDHLGKPPIGSGLNSAAGERWLGSMKRLAENPRVAVKLSGLNPESDRSRPLSEQALPFLQAALDLFGTRRAMIGSDWPVSMSGQNAPKYDQWFSLVLDGLNLSESERANLAEGSARRIYGLFPLPPSTESTNLANS
jgi:L-fuconolactonase